MINDEQIQAILNAIDHITPDEAHDQSQPHRTITIYIEVQEDETDQPPIIESTLDEQERETDDTNIPRATEQVNPSTNDTEGHQTPRQRRPRPLVLLFLILALVGVLAAGVASTVLVPLWTPSASITIVTASQPLTTTSTPQVVTSGTADPTKNQLPGRTLAAVTMSQQKTVPTRCCICQESKVSQSR